MYALFYCSTAFRRAAGGDEGGQGAFVYCPDCGHQNPNENKFCGMCGERLPEREARSGGARPNTRTAEMRTEDVIRGAAADRRERVADKDPEPVAASLRHREPIDEPVREIRPVTSTPVNRSSNALAEERVITPKPAPPRRNQEPDYVPESALPPAVATLYEQRRPSAAPAEQPTTLSGPSFLGLSSSSGDSSYSYLYEEEQPKSHAGAIVFLIVLAILAAVVYWQWQPIHDFVVNTALSHSNVGRPSPTQGTTPESSAPAPGTTAATSDQNSAPTGTAPQGNAAGTSNPDQPKIDTSQPKSEAAPDKSNADKSPKDETPQAEVGEKSGFQDADGKGKADEPSEEVAEDAKPSPTKRAAPAAAAGAELVASGEKHLYGKGVPRNCGQAVTAFSQAAKQQNPSAMSHLGAMYATGECVPFDRVRAYQWYSKALAQNRSNTYLEHNLNMLWREMTPREQAQVTGKKTF